MNIGKLLLPVSGIETTTARIVVTRLLQSEGESAHTLSHADVYYNETTFFSLSRKMMRGFFNDGHVLLINIV